MNTSINTYGYMSDIIGDDYTKWNNCNIILSGGTGTGKTQFIIRKLIPYYNSQNKKILYLANRKALEKQLSDELKQYDTVTLLTYQRLQADISKSKSMDSYDLIIADECHYFYTDAMFNEMVDLSYNYLLYGVKNGVTIFMSATGDTIFKDLICNNLVTRDHIYYIPRRYPHVEKVYSYIKEELVDIINDILGSNDNEKILVFVNSIDRLKQLHDIYGDDADYMCSGTNTVNFANNQAIQNKTFGKRILVTTKVLDNGIDLVDDDLKHIVCEIFDIDSCLQCIGRKRPIDSLDTCCLYFMLYDRRAVRNFLNKNEEQLDPVLEYLSNKDKYLFDLNNLNINVREITRKNRIFYTDLDDKKLYINHVRLNKYKVDNAILNRMIDTSYEQVLFEELGEEISQKRKTLKIKHDMIDTFQMYLDEITGDKLFKEQQQELKERFKSILGLHARRMGLGTLNGTLKDYGYSYVITSHRENVGTLRNKRYWRVDRI